MHPGRRTLLPVVRRLANSGNGFRPIQLRWWPFSRPLDPLPEDWTGSRLVPILRPMSGIDFVVDERGRKKAVVIDLDRHGEIWEDLHDAMVVKSRKREPRESLTEVEKRLERRRSG